MKPQQQKHKTCLRRFRRVQISFAGSEQCKLLVCEGRLRELVAANSFARQSPDNLFIQFLRKDVEPYTPIAKARGLTALMVNSSGGSPGLGHWDALLYQDYPMPL